jgi:GNAT superfamily N-acetyltransferase
MPDTYTIALAEASHLAAIPVIEQAAAATFAMTDLPLHLRYRVTDAEALREAQAAKRLWVALGEAGDPVGFALAENADGQAYLSEIDVHPHHARRGLGTRLVSAVVDWATSKGYDSVLLVTFRHLPWNAPFYERLGFVQMNHDDLGPELREFIDEEAAAGITRANRVGMRLQLQPRRRPAHP